MTLKEKEMLSTILKSDPWKVRPLLEKFIQDAAVMETSEKRTSQQNKALHAFFNLLADELNDAGLPMQKVLHIDIDWDADTVKEYLWRPVQKAQLGKESTTELTREEVSKVYDTLNRLLGEKWGVHVPFPSAAFTHYNEYPEYTGKPTI